MEGKFIIEREITYCSNSHMSYPERVELTFDAEDVDRIARVMNLVKENKLHSARIDFGGYVLLNEDGEEDTEFNDDQAQLIVYENGVNFYCQDGDCNQLESDSISFDEILSSFAIIVPSNEIIA